MWHNSLKPYRCCFLHNLVTYEGGCVCVCARACLHVHILFLFVFCSFPSSVCLSLYLSRLHLSPSVSLFTSLFSISVWLSLSLYISLSLTGVCFPPARCMMLDFVTVVSEALNQHVCLFVNLIPASKDTLKKNPGHVVICHTLLLCLLWLTPALPPTHTQSAVLRCLIMECRCM